MIINSSAFEMTTTELSAISRSALFGQYINVPAVAANYSYSEFAISSGLDTATAISYLLVAPAAAMDIWVSVETSSIGVGYTQMYNLTTHAQSSTFGWGAWRAPAISSNKVSYFPTVPTTGIVIPCPIGGTVGLNTVVVWAGTVNTAFSLSSRVIVTQAPYL